MKLAISGTYSSGKTLTVMALARYTGIPRTLARTIRSIMPDAVPGKSLADVTPPEYVQLAVRRHVGRAVNEALLPGGFIADGSSLQEWVYAILRVRYGMDPSRMTRLVEVEKTAEMRFFEDVMNQLGRAFKQHVKDTFDLFVHLRHELPLADDGHRPMNEDFRAQCDRMLLAAIEEMGMPYHMVGGSIGERLETIAGLLSLEPVMDLDRAIEEARREHATQDMTFETARAGSAG